MEIMETQFRMPHKFKTDCGFTLTYQEHKNTWTDGDLVFPSGQPPAMHPVDSEGRPLDGVLKTRKVWKRVCGACRGSGFLRNYRHVQGGRCFPCQGLGHEWLKTDPDVLQKRREKAKAKRDAEQAVRVAEAAVRSKARAEKYKDDPRVGPITRTEYVDYPEFMNEVYRILEQVDAGNHYREGQAERILQNFAK